MSLEYLDEHHLASYERSLNPRRVIRTASRRTRQMKRSKVPAINKFEVVRSRTIPWFFLSTAVPSVMSTSAAVRQRTTKSTKNENLIKVTSEGEQRDKELDKHDTYV